MDPFEEMLASATRDRDEAEELAREVTAGTALLEEGMTRQRALQVLNGCIEDYNMVIKRLGARHRG